MIRVLVVDDEPLARDALKDLLLDECDVEVVGECGNAVDALAAINRTSPDAVFLDILMPRISGIELLSMLDPQRMPRIIFLTAHEDYALQAFEGRAFDYVLKPIEKLRLQKTLDALRDKNRSMPSVTRPLLRIPCSGLHRISLFKVEEIEAAVSRPGGIYVMTTDGVEHFTELTLRTMEDRTPLIRCHRQYMINPDHIRDIALCDGGGALIETCSNHTVPVSRRFFGLLKEHLGIA